MAAQSRPRRVPQRTCIACRRIETKRRLTRIVRTADGGVLRDPGGKLAGRGAYLCDERGCWETALRRGAVERALRVTLRESDRAALLEYASQLPETPVATESTMD